MLVAIHRLGLDVVVLQLETLQSAPSALALLLGHSAQSVITIANLLRDGGGNGARRCQILIMSKPCDLCSFAEDRNQIVVAIGQCERNHTIERLVTEICNLRQFDRETAVVARLHHEARQLQVGQKFRSLAEGHFEKQVFVDIADRILEVDHLAGHVFAVQLCLGEGVILIGNDGKCHLSVGLYRGRRSLYASALGAGNRNIISSHADDTTRNPQVEVTVAIVIDDVIAIDRISTQIAPSGITRLVGSRIQAIAAIDTEFLWNRSSECTRIDEVIVLTEVVNLRRFAKGGQQLALGIGKSKLHGAAECELGHIQNLGNRHFDVSAGIGDDLQSRGLQVSGIFRESGVFTRIGYNDFWITRLPADRLLDARTRLFGFDNDFVSSCSEVRRQRNRIGNLSVAGKRLDTISPRQSTQKGFR